MSWVYMFAMIIPISRVVPCLYPSRNENIQMSQFTEKCNVAHKDFGDPCPS